MCGLVGFLNLGKDFTPNAEAVITSMSDAITHRGPDSSGTWQDSQFRIALGHRRLSIIDLSLAGHQPMISPSGRYVMVFNGEMYNHLDVRHEIESIESSIKWRGHSDTETILASFDIWGLKSSIQKFNGMFAIAVWDRANKSLTLIRDRIGEKPLYYGIQKDTLIFGSELSSFTKHPHFIGEIDRGSLALLLQQKYIPAPHSIYKGINKLLPGKMIEFRYPDFKPEETTFWDPKLIIEHSLKNQFEGTFEDAVNSLETRLKASVKEQLLSDVPLGAFLSGGIDSSSVVSIMQSLSSKPIKTFTIGFHEKKFNEAEHAKAVAKHLGTDHEEWYITAQDTLNLVPKLPTIYSEPFADKSLIPTVLLCEMTRKKVTVSLSGDGGDELFSGYTRYRETNKWFEKASKIPRPLWKSASLGVRGISLFDRKWKEFSDLLSTDTESEFYRRRITKWHNAENIIINSNHNQTIFSNESLQPQTSDIVERMMAIDMMSYLPDYILCKVDRAAMASSLETRIPLLNHQLVEFAWTLPMKYKVQGNKGKLVLRSLLDRYVPNELIERPKRGFSVPVNEWLRGPLKSWADDLLSEQRSKSDGYFNSAEVLKQWKQHKSGRHDRSESLWSILMFQAWLQNQKR